MTPRHPQEPFGPAALNIYKFPQKKNWFLAFARKILIKNDIDLDLIDLTSLYDSTLTLEENKTQLLSFLSGLVSQEPYDKDYVEHLTREMCQRQLDYIQRQRDLAVKGKPPVRLKSKQSENGDLTAFTGFKGREDVAGLIIQEMLQRCKQRFIQGVNERKIHELQDRAEERGPYAPSIKGFPPTPPKNPPENILQDPQKRPKPCRFIVWKEDLKGRKQAHCSYLQHACSPEGCKTRFQSDLDRTQRFDFYPLVKHDFTIPGLGEPGGACCAVDSKRIAAFSQDYSKVRVRRVVCKRVGCPRCSSLWIKTRAFEITLAMEISAFLRNERPFGVVSSINPKEIYFRNWNWQNFNRSLFNRAYRRGKGIGIQGGFVFFHPFRIRKAVKKRLRAFRKTLSGQERRLSEGDAGFWRMIKQDVLAYGDFYRYVKVGPHLHSLCFGDPREHTDPDFFIGISEEEIAGRKTGRPHRLKTTQDVVGLVMYLLTHCGISTLDKIIQPTRRYGCMYDFQVKAEKPRYGEANTMFEVLKLPEEHAFRLFDPEWISWFETEWLPEKCREIADYIDMQWSDAEGLSMKDGQQGDDVVWLPIWKIYQCIEDIRNTPGLSYEVVSFYQRLLDYLEKYGTPPPLLPTHLIESSPLYWAAGYLTGLEIPDELEICQEDEGAEPEAIINRIDPEQERKFALGKSLRKERETIEQVITDQGMEDTPAVRKWRLYQELNNPDPEVRLRALKKIGIKEGDL